jgi:hypothetical protein
VNHQQDGALSLSWQPELADYVEAFRARNRARKAWHKIWGLAGIALVIAVAVSVAGTASSMAFPCFFAAVGFPVAALVISPLSVRSFWRRNPALHSPLQACVDPTTGITLTGQSTGQHPWSTIHSFLETNRVFVVQLSGYRSLGFLLLAKRGLSDERHVDDLRTLLSRALLPN